MCKEHCGGAHPAYECRKKSTAARSNARVMADCLCEVCGKGFKAVPHEVKRGRARSCSKTCAAKLASRPDQSGERNPNWKGGVPKTDKNRRYVARYPEKHEAHRLMTNAIRRGELVRKPCEVCGEIKVDGHHEDYSKPLDVRWLCRVHHIEAHNGRFGEAGTQALPVDTNTRVEDNVGSRLLMSEAPETTSAGTVGYKDRQPIPKRGRGRPRTITDMRAYKAMKQREYRARKKNG